MKWRIQRGKRERAIQERHKRNQKSSTESSRSSIESEVSAEHSEHIKGGASLLFYNRFKHLGRKPHQYSVACWTGIERKPPSSHHVLFNLIQLEHARTLQWTFSPDGSFLKQYDLLHTFCQEQFNLWGVVLFSSALAVFFFDKQLDFIYLSLSFLAMRFVSVDEFDIL